MKKFFVLPAVIILFSFFFQTLFAQSAEIRDVRKKEFKGVHAIVNEQTKEVEGYYSFYVNEKVGGGMINFVIAIFDVELNLVKQTPITISKKSVVDGSEFNGKDFLFVMNDLRAKKLTYITVDKTGNIIKTKGIKEAKRYAATADVYPANDAFFIVKPIKEKKWGYSIEKVDRDLNTLWEKRFVVDKGMVGVEDVEAGEDRIIVIQITRAALMSKKVKGELVCLSAEDGSILYKYPLFDQEVTGIPSAFLIDKDKNVVTGGMYFKGEKWANTNSAGIFFLKLSPKGEMLEYKKSDWKSGIQSMIEEGSKKTLTISSKPKVLFHQIVQSEDGGYQIIGETFKKSIQLVSIKLKDVITGRYIGNINDDDNNRPFTFEVMDFIIFNYNNEGSLTNVNIIEKEHTKITCYRPYNYMGGLRLAQYVKEFGWFNFAFTTTIPKSDQQHLISARFLKKNAYIGITSIDMGKKSVTHKIPITRKTIKGGNIGVMRSKPGYLCIYIYSKKEKTVFIYLEEIKLS